MVMHAQLSPEDKYIVLPELGSVFLERLEIPKNRIKFMHMELFSSFTWLLDRFPNALEMGKISAETAGSDDAWRKDDDLFVVILFGLTTKEQYSFIIQRTWIWCIVHALPDNARIGGYPPKGFYADEDEGDEHIEPLSLFGTEAASPVWTSQEAQYLQVLLDGHAAQPTHVEGTAPAADHSSIKVPAVAAEREGSSDAGALSLPKLAPRPTLDPPSAVPYVPQRDPNDPSRPYPRHRRPKGMKYKKKSGKKKNAAGIK